MCIINCLSLIGVLFITDKWHGHVVGHRAQSSEHRRQSHGHPVSQQSLHQL